jgi:hypothetical protein
MQHDYVSKQKLKAGMYAIAQTLERAVVPDYRCADHGGKACEYQQACAESVRNNQHVNRLGCHLHDRLLLN